MEYYFLCPVDLLANSTKSKDKIIEKQVLFIDSNKSPNQLSSQTNYKDKTYVVTI